MKMSIEDKGIAQKRDVSAQMVRAMLLAWHQYVPQPYNGNALLFRALDKYVLPSDRKYGWNLLVRGGLETQKLEGDHSNILECAEVKDLAYIMKDYIKRHFKSKIRKKPN